MNSKQHRQTRLQESEASTTRLQALTPTEMQDVHGGDRKPEVHCYESPNKVINDDAVWYEVKCDG